MTKLLVDSAFDIGRDLQSAYEEGYKQGRYDERVENGPKIGEWIFEETDEYKRTYCSVCGAAAPFICISEDYYGRRLHGRRRKTKFCPNCGADMRGENR